MVLAVGALLLHGDIRDSCRRAVAGFPAECETAHFVESLTDWTRSIQLCFFKISISHDDECERNFSEQNHDPNDDNEPAHLVRFEMKLNR